MAAEYAPTNVYDEYFSDEFGTSWLVKGERVPTAEKAIEAVTEVEGKPEDGHDVSLRRARIEWRDVDGWWLTIDPEGAYEVWQVEW